MSDYFSHRLYPVLLFCESGNFSQVVWKSTTHAGFGITSKDGGCNIFIAAYYKPSGNLSGRFTENVPRPINGVDYIPSAEEMGW